MNLAFVISRWQPVAALAVLTGTAAYQAAAGEAAPFTPAPVGVVEVIENFETPRAEKCVFPDNTPTPEQRRKFVCAELTDDAKFGERAIRFYTAKGRKVTNGWKPPRPHWTGMRFQPYVLPPQADCLTFWAKVKGPPVRLHTRASTTPPGSLCDIIVDGPEWKKYTLDFADFQATLLSKQRRDRFHFFGEFVSDNFIEFDVLLHPMPTDSVEESVVTIDQIQYENRGAGRLKEYRIQTDDAHTDIVQMIDDFESGPRKMLKEIWIRWDYRIVQKLPDGGYHQAYAPQRRHSWIDTKWRYAKITDQAKNGKGAGHLAGNIGDEGHTKIGWDVKQVPRSANGIAFWFRTETNPERQTFFVQIWCIPEDKRPLAATPTPAYCEPFGADYAWGFNLDLEGGKVDLPRAMYGVCIDMKGVDTTNWHRVVIPFRDLSYVMGYKMPSDTPIQRGQIARVSIRNSFKNHYYKNTIFLDDLALVNITNLQGEPCPSAFPPSPYKTFRQWGQEHIEAYRKGPAGTSWQLELDNPNSRTHRAARRRKASPKAPSAVGLPRSSAVITVDGDLKEWAAIKPMPMPYMKKKAGAFRLCWTPRGLYGAIVATDGTIRINRAEPWTADAVEVFVDKDLSRPRARNGNSSQYVFGPAPDSDAGRGLIKIAYGSEIDRKANVECVWKPVTGGYNLEFFIPAEALAPAAMRPGTTIGMNFALSNDGKPVEQFASDKAVTWDSPAHWGAVKLER